MKVLEEEICIKPPERYNGRVAFMFKESTL